MKAIIVTDRTAGIAGMRLVDRPDPDAARLASLDGASYGDVVVEVHASGFTGNELDWPSTWTDREGRDRSPTIPGHEVAGIVTALSYGAAGLAVGQRVFGLTDWTRDGSLAEYAVVEARNLAPLAGDVDFVTGAGVAMTGLTAWQGLFEHGRLTAGQTVLVHGVAGAVGSMAAQLARDAGAYVVGTGRASHRLAALDFGANEFLDLENDDLDDAAGVDLVFDVFGGDIRGAFRRPRPPRRHLRDRRRTAGGATHRRPQRRLRGGLGPRAAHRDRTPRAHRTGAPAHRPGRRTRGCRFRSRPRDARSREDRHPHPPLSGALSRAGDAGWCTSARRCAARARPRGRARP